MYFTTFPKIKFMSVLLVYSLKQYVQNCIIATELISNSVMLNRNEFIHVSLIFIGCIVTMRGILTPTLKVPFCVHHNKYMARKANIPVERKPNPLFSSLTNIVLRNGANGTPFDFLATSPISI